MSDFLPNRLNEPPSVFNGCSWEEIAWVSALAFVVSLLLGVMVISLGGKWIVLFACLTVGTLVGIYIGSKIMSRVKRGKPPGYYKTGMHIKLQKLGIRKITTITKSRVWDIGSK
jgi:conjugative transfer region protein (TIGR03750 family)